MRQYFDYGPLLISYSPDEGDYEINEVNYAEHIGIAKVYEGPGACLNVAHVQAVFLDASAAQAVADFLSDLNETIED